MAKLRFVTSTAAAAALMLGVPAAAQEVVPAPAPVVAPTAAPASGAAERTLGSESGGRANVLYLGPLSLLGGGIPLEFERALTPGSSFAIFGGFNAPIGLASVFQAAGVSVTGGSIGGSYRGYFTGSAPTGLFIGPEVEVSFLNITAPGTDAAVSATTVNGRALVGYSLVTPGGFAVSTGVGVGYGTNSATVASGGAAATGQGHGFSFHLRAHIGYGF